MNSRSVYGFIKKHNMLEKGDTVVVGLSGGADSVCLLNVLCELREELSLKLRAAHINHKIRGEEADRDESFCVKLCEELGVELSVKHADIPKLSRELHLSEEECGRRVRYEFFELLAGENGKIATAHNLNDNAETLIFNLSRGSSLRGACGIPAVRGKIIRPLLETDREEIEKYLKEKGASFVTDSTNLENAYTRNRIRNELMPLLKELNSSAQRNISDFIKYANEDESFIESELDRIYPELVEEEKLLCERFCALDISLRRRAAARYLKDYVSNELSARHIDALLSFVEAEGDALINISDKRFKKEGTAVLPYPLPSEPFCREFKKGDCELVYPYGTVRLERIERKDLQNIKIILLDNLIDCDKINDNLILRSRKPSDSFTFFKRGVTKTLKKLFIEEKIPQSERNKIAVLESGGEVVFVEGFGTNKKFKADNASKNILKIIINGENDSEH